MTHGELDGQTWLREKRELEERLEAHLKACREMERQRTEEPTITLPDRMPGLSICTSAERFRPGGTTFDPDEAYRAEGSPPWLILVVAGVIGLALAVWYRS